MDELLRQLPKESINYIALGLVGGIIANIRSLITFLRLPTVTWPKGKVSTQLRQWAGILFEIFYRPVVGAAMAYAVDINPLFSFFVGLIAPALIDIITKDGPKMFKQYWEKKLLGDDSGSEKKETVKVVSAGTLDPKLLKTLEDKAVSDDKNTSD